MRIEKVNSSIKRELGMILQIGEVNDPRISFVTIMSVDTSKDLQHARVKYSTLSDAPKDIKAAQAGFDSSRGFIRRLISQRLALRYTPEFQFIYDKSVKYASHLDEVLEEIKHLKSPNQEGQE
jgi:ribosome-binding factor A